jgi:hypothetical protein
MKTAPVVALWALACTLALPAQAFNPQPDPPARIGAITLNPGQTLRVNARVIKAVSPSNADVPPGPCRVSLSFLDGGGRNLGLGTIVLLRQGQATRLDLIGDELSSTANPLSVHPVVRLLPAVQRPSSSAQTCAVAVTVELLDATGQVKAIVADPLLVTQDSAEQ